MLRQHVLGAQGRAVVLQLRGEGMAQRVRRCAWAPRTGTALSVSCWFPHTAMLAKNSAPEVVSPTVATGGFADLKSGT
jgi:hypothetical protein